MSLDSIRIQNGQTERLKVQATDVDSAGVTAATITLVIRRDDLGYYWNGTTFTSTFASVTMVETNAANLPGFYHYDFHSTVHDITCTFYASTATLAVTNDPWAGEIKIGGFVDYLDSAVSGRASQTLENSHTSQLQEEMRRLRLQVEDVYRALKNMKAL